MYSCFHVWEPLGVRSIRYTPGFARRPQWRPFVDLSLCAQKHEKMAKNIIQQFVCVKYVLVASPALPTDQGRPDISHCGYHSATEDPSKGCDVCVWLLSSCLRAGIWHTNHRVRTEGKVGREPWLRETLWTPDPHVATTHKGFT